MPSPFEAALQDARTVILEQSTLRAAERSLQFHIITLFPEMIAEFATASLIGKAVESGRISVSCVDPRSFSSDKHRTVDDSPYGGGAGMVLKVQPIADALDSISGGPEGRPHRILLSPQGARLTQGRLQELARLPRIALICGRYEGFDERIRGIVDEEISLGDFVLNGGEVAAMALVDGIARLLPGVIGNEASLQGESHDHGLLSYPQYTRPREFHGQAVPEVLISGDHERIARWRQLQRLQRTRERRPDLWRRYALSSADRAALAEADGLVAEPAAAGRRAYVALLHYPVYDREGNVVTTALTNLDLHDIARSARTYGLGGYYVVTPLESQRALAKRIVDHWHEGHGARQHPRRREALALVETAESLSAVVCDVERREGQKPLVVATGAALSGPVEHPSDIRGRLEAGQVVVLVLGTGWGLAWEIIDAADVALAPIRGPDDYNHLSVRSAAGIILDRLFGMREEQ